MRFSLVTVSEMFFLTGCAVGETSGGQQCGNQICEAGESNLTCSADCYCGNGTCGLGESDLSCPRPGAQGDPERG